MPKDTQPSNGRENGPDERTLDLDLDLKEQIAVLRDDLDELSADLGDFAASRSGVGDSTAALALASPLIAPQLFVGGLGELPVFGASALTLATLIGTTFATGSLTGPCASGRATVKLPKDLGKTLRIYLLEVRVDSASQCSVDVSYLLLPKNSQASQRVRPGETRTVLLRGPQTATLQASGGGGNCVAAYKLTRTDKTTASGVGLSEEIDSRVISNACGTPVEDIDVKSQGSYSVNLSVDASSDCSVDLTIRTPGKVETQETVAPGGSVTAAFIRRGKGEDRKIQIQSRAGGQTSRYDFRVLKA